MRTFLFKIFFVLWAAAFSVSAQSSSVIKNALIIDGSGRAAFRADVRIAGDKIVKIGNLKAKNGEPVIDAEGKILAPGFIDIHNHSETGLLREGTATSQVSQGITTILVGPDGSSPFPVGDYLAKLEGKIAPNVGAFIGHATLREQILKEDYKRPATSEEILRMAELTEKAMQEGAFGLSSGLEYDVGVAAKTEELIELSRIAAKYDGIYMTHIRDEEEGMLNALREAIRIGREAKLPVQISHIKMGNKLVWGKSVDAISIIEAERKKGLDITADAYPYTAWASTMAIIVPSRRFDDVKEVERGINNVGGPDKILIGTAPSFPEFQGKTLGQLSLMQKVPYLDLFTKIMKNGGAYVVCDSMSEADVKTFYKQPWVMVSSDGGIGGRHPRGTGTFPRVLGRFVREENLLSLEEAIRKMTSFPAQRLKLKNRGYIKKGMKADLVLFDKEKVIDRNTFLKPEILSAGIETVFVNGVKVWENGKVTGNLAGEILRRK